MILVTVGMHSQPFDRLVRAADEMAAALEERVVIQRGSSRYVPRFGQDFDFVAETAMEEWLSEARVVVAHGGAGSILNALGALKPLVLVPRRKSFGEHIDDHQLELAGALAQQGRAIVVTDLTPETLRQAIAQAERLDGARAASSDLKQALSTWLSEQAARSPAERQKPKFLWRRRD